MRFQIFSNNSSFGTGWLLAFINKYRKSLSIVSLK